MSEAFPQLQINSSAEVLSSFFEAIQKEQGWQKEDCKKVIEQISTARTSSQTSNQIGGR
jgi:hypothetical protein